jgi:glycosyltransferase involved in cell wall biosynthesis
MKVATISTYVSNGGAAIAAFRLHQGLMRHKDVESVIIQKYAEDREFMRQNNVYLVEKDKSLIEKTRRKLNIDTVTLQNKKLENFGGKYEIASVPFSSYRLEEHPIVKEADILHLHWVADNFLNYPTFFKNVKQPVVWTLHDMNPFQGLFHYRQDEINSKGKLRDFDKKIHDIKLKAIHKKNNIHIVTLSSWLKEYSESSSSFGKYPHYLIPNGLNFDNYPVLNKKQIKKEKGLDNGLKTLLFIAADIGNNRKGFDLLLAAINKPELKSFNLISIGGEKIFVNEKVNHLHYEKITDIQELNKTYSVADLTILPSREDNLPNVMLESFANGTPIISFGNGGMSEHIKNGENGILIKDINPNALAVGINDFLEDKYHFDNETIQKYAINNFSDNQQIEKYIDLYHSILNS